VSSLYAPADADAQARIARASQWVCTHTPASPGQLAVMLSAFAVAGDTADTLQVVRLGL
jgi:hypothetical protein